MGNFWLFVAFIKSLLPKRKKKPGLSSVFYWPDPPPRKAVQKGDMWIKPPTYEQRVWDGTDWVKPDVRP